MLKYLTVLVRKELYFMKRKFILMGLLTILLAGCAGDSSSESSTPSEDSLPSSTLNENLIDNDVRDGYKKAAKGEKL